MAHIHRTLLNNLTSAILISPKKTHLPAMPPSTASRSPARFTAAATVQTDSPAQRPYFDLLPPPQPTLGRRRQIQRRCGLSGSSRSSARRQEVGPVRRIVGPRGRHCGVAHRHIPVPGISISSCRGQTNEFLSALSIH
jgi:hypothetical protein